MTQKEEWIEWGGGSRPVDAMVQAQFRGWTIEQASASDPSHSTHLAWRHQNNRSDIIAYRVVHP